MLGAILSFLAGGAFDRLAAPFLEAQRRVLEAQGTEARIDAEQRLAALSAARAIALEEAGDRWSATRIGRALIVIPFGLWLSAIFAVSIINPVFGVNFVIHDVPARVWDICTVLVPAIVIADAGALTLRRRSR